MSKRILTYGPEEAFTIDPLVERSDDSSIQYFLEVQRRALRMISRDRVFIVYSPSKSTNLGGLKFQRYESRYGLKYTLLDSVDMDPIYSNSHSQIDVLKKSILEKLNSIDLNPVESPAPLLDAVHGGDDPRGLELMHLAYPSFFNAPHISPKGSTVILSTIQTQSQLFSSRLLTDYMNALFGEKVLKLNYGGAVGTSRLRGKAILHLVDVQDDKFAIGRNMHSLYNVLLDSICKHEKLELAERKQQLEVHHLTDLILWKYGLSAAPHFVLMQVGDELNGGTRRLSDKPLKHAVDRICREALVETKVLVFSNGEQCGVDYKRRQLLQSDTVISARGELADTAHWTFSKVSNSTLNSGEWSTVIVVNVPVSSAVEHAILKMVEAPLSHFIFSGLRSIHLTGYIAGASFRSTSMYPVSFEEEDSDYILLFAQSPTHNPTRLGQLLRKYFVEFVDLIDTCRVATGSKCPEFSIGMPVTANYEDWVLSKSQWEEWAIRVVDDGGDLEDITRSFDNLINTVHDATADLSRNDYYRIIHSILSNTLPVECPNEPTCENACIAKWSTFSVDHGQDEWLTRSSSAAPDPVSNWDVFYSI
eukprot:GHVH01009992.1.p1 GENE.GHVH01009992.1~~GHVH01009992.1.p1  ORF type:complete len:590 (+),score=82.80 GHVH01009992.1:1302-3071(+)